MCGIAGALVYSRQSDANRRRHDVDPRRISDAVSHMVSHLRHRGPDSSGVQIVSCPDSAPAVFGATRLAILDLSPSGEQPMASDDGQTWITFNGEIYNFRQLRDGLTESGRAWRSTGDTEVMLRAYQRWGLDCLDRFRGMFAFALFDRGPHGTAIGQSSVGGRLLLARDRFGIKPLYYYAGDGIFIFASEVRALLASGLVPRRLDRIALEDYLAYQSVPAPRTLVEGVRMLPPGHWLSVDVTGQITGQPYWDLLVAAHHDLGLIDESVVQRRVADLLREAVALHLVSDVPVGVFLSGGIDSSAITALVREAGEVPRTFSVSFGDPGYDESRYARIVAEKWKTDHTEIQLSEAEVCEQLPLALQSMDHPSGDAVNTYIVSQAVHAAGMKVALSGLGGDELFAGYSTFQRLSQYGRFLRAWGQVPRFVRRMVAETLLMVGGKTTGSTKLAAILATDGSLAEVYPVLRQVLSRDQRNLLLHIGDNQDDVGRPDPYVSPLREAFAHHDSTGSLGMISFAELRTYMHDVLLRDSDQMTMAHSLELRVPFLDHELVQYVVGLPDSVKKPFTTPKRLLVESLGGLLPPEIVNRPKRGFVLPMGEWMRAPLRSYCKIRLGPSRLAGRSILQSDGVASLWSKFLERDPNVSWSRVWLLVALEEWLATNLDGGTFG